MVAEPLTISKKTCAQSTKTVANSPEMNGAAERAIGVLKQCVRGNLLASHMSYKHCSHAALDCANRLNQLPRSEDEKVPKELLNETKPKDVHRLEPFGTYGYVSNKSR